MPRARSASDMSICSWLAGSEWLFEASLLGLNYFNSNIYMHAYIHVCMTLFFILSPAHLYIHTVEYM